MRFKNIQIILPFISYAFMVLSTPIYYNENLDIGEYFPNDKPTNKKLLAVRNVISEVEEEKVSYFENSDSDEEEIAIDSDNEVEEITSNSETEEEEIISNSETEEEEIISNSETEEEEITSNSEIEEEEISIELEEPTSNDGSDDKFSDEDYLSINWNRTPEELKSIVNNEYENEEKIIAQIESIPDEECSFESVIVTLEQKVLGPMYQTIYPMIEMHNFHPDESIRKISGEINSNFTVNQVNFFLNKKIYHKVLMVKENIKNGLFDEPEITEDKRLIDIYESNFQRSGVDIPEEQTEEYFKIVSELSNLATQFYECLSTANSTISFKKDELEGLPSLDIFEKTEENGEEIYKIGVNDPSFKAISHMAKKENTRKRVQIAEVNKCPSNVDLLKKSINLNLKKAKILGYPSHASYQLENRMAESPDKVIEFLEDIKEKTKPVFKKLLDELLEMKKKDKDELKEPFDNKINYWDLGYYVRIYMENKYGVKEEEFKEYFQVDKVLEETLELFGNVFLIKFVEVKNPSVWSPDVRVFNVYDKSTKQLLGPIYFDLFKRLGKHDGFASPFSIRYEKEDGNYSIPSAGVFLGLTPQKHPDKPSLMKQSEISTLFHELGHAIHFISSNVKWPTYQPFNVEFDFIEGPSQLLEYWACEPKVLTELSHHKNDTNIRIPSELINNTIKINEIDKIVDVLFSSSLSMVDMKMQSITEEDENIDVVKIFNEEMKDGFIEFDKDILLISNITHFISTYDAGYYGYLWSEVYSADMFYSQFKKNGIFNSEVGERYRKVVLSKSASEDAMDFLTEFLGRKPNNEAFIKSITSEN